MDWAGQCETYGWGRPVCMYDIRCTVSKACGIRSIPPLAMLILNAPSAPDAAQVEDEIRASECTAARSRAVAPKNSGAPKPVYSARKTSCTVHYRER